MPTRFSRTKKAGALLIRANLTDEIYRVATAPLGTDTTQAASTAYVQNELAALDLDAVVIGPASVTDDLPAVFDGTTGKLLKQKTYAAFKTLLALVKGDVGLGNVDNTSDATKNAASATLTNKTLTSPVINSPTGIVKGDVGLGNVDNTSDAAKPVSTATQTALDLKANLISPSFTTPALGVATVTTLNGVTITGAGTFTVPTGSSLVRSGAHSLTLTTGSTTVATLPGGTVTLCGIGSSQTLTLKTLTAPDINGGTADSLTSFSIRSTGAAFDMLQAMSEAISANRTLTWSLGNTDRSITLGGNVTTSNDFVYAASTFTPTVTLVGGAGNTVPVYTTNDAQYTRIGNRVFVDINLEGDGGAEGAGTGVLTLNLPLTVSATFPNGSFPAGTARNGTAEYIVQGSAQAGTTSCSLFYFDTIANRASFTGDLQNNATRFIRLQFNYMV